MDLASDGDRSSSLALSAKIVSAYLEHNSLSATDIPRLLTDVYTALEGLRTAAPLETPAPRTPAVAIKKSVTPDFITCLEDGRKFKSMKRHLAGLGMTPDEYRSKWGLPQSYPMVAPNYAATRSRLAKAIGLGKSTSASPGKRKARKAA